MRFKLLTKLVAFLVVVTAMQLSAKHNTASTEKIPLSKDVRTGTLPNGFKYFIKKNAKPDDHAHFRIVLNAGAINEDDDQNGLAHFTEHMCFNGTKNYPKNVLLDVLQKFGIRFGADVNASTGLDITMYELPIPIKDEKLVKESFQILEDWAHQVTMLDDDINGERNIIMSEWRQRNNANGRLRDKHAPVQYFNSKYATRNIIGDTFLLQNFKPEVIRRFYKEWYRPNLMALVAVGDFDVDEIEKMTKEYFGRATNPENARARQEYDVPFHTDLKVSIASDKEMPFEMATIITKLPKRDENSFAGYAESTKRQLIDMMFNERLQEIANKPGAQFISAGAGEGDFQGNKRAYYSSIRSKNGNISKAIEAYLIEAARMKQHGFNEAEFDRAKADMMAYLDNVIAQKGTTKHEAYVDELTEYFMGSTSMGGVDFDYEFSKQVVEEVQLSELNAMTAPYLTPENTVITINLPEKDDASKLKEKALLSMFKRTMNEAVEAKVEEKITKPLFSKDVTPGKIVKSDKNDKLGIETLVLSNGAKVVLKKTDFKENQIMFGAYSWGGTSLYSDKDFFSADLATAMITEGGVGEFNKTDLGKVLTGKTAGVSPILDDYYEGFQGGCVKKDMETMFQLVNLYATSTREDKEAYNTFVEKVKPSLLAKGNSQDDVFRDSVSWIMGDHHFRRQPFTVKHLDYADFNRGIQIYKERFSNAGDFNFFLVGDFDIDLAKQYFEKYIASLPQGKEESYKDLKIGYPKKKVETTFNKGTEDRAHLRLAITGDFKWSQENRHRLDAMVEALEIRMIEVIREKMGGTYSPSLWAEMDKIPNGSYAINMDLVVEPKRVDELVAGIKQVMQDMKEKEDEEATFKVKKAQEQQRVLDLKNNNYWFSVLQSYHKNGEDYSTIENWDTLISSLTAKDVQNAAKQYLNFDKMSKILVMPETSK